MAYRPAHIISEVAATDQHQQVGARTTVAAVRTVCLDQQHVSSVQRQTSQSGRPFQAAYLPDVTLVY